MFTEVYASLHTEIENAGGNRPHLVVLQGPGLGDFFEITDDELVLGSDPFGRHRGAGRGGRTAARRALQETRRPCPAGRRSREDHRAQRRGDGGAGVRATPIDGDRIHVGDSVLEYSHQDEIKASFFEQLHELVNRDHLTGLYSKGRFDREFEHRLEAMADEGRP